MQLNHPTGMVEGPPDLPGETIRKTQVPVESCMQLAPSAATDFAKGVDQLAAEGIVANQLLPEVLPRFREARDHRPITAGERDVLFRIGITIHYTMLFRVASIGHVVELNAPQQQTPRPLQARAFVVINERQSN